MISGTRCFVTCHWSVPRLIGMEPSPNARTVESYEQIAADYAGRPPATEYLPGHWRYWPRPSQQVMSSRSAPDRVGMQTSSRPPG